jgi:GNAT superfamily N-acetyltransferase
MEYERLKATGDYLLAPPTIEMKQWVNARTGEVTWVPEGIDPGWGTNPGLARAKTLVENVAKRTQEAVEIARKEIKSAPPVVVTGKDFHRPGILLWGTSDSAEVFAKTWERVIGKKPADFFAALVKGAPAERMSVKISGSGKPGKPASIGTEMVLKNGRRRVAELNRTYAMDAEGELTVVHSFFLVRHHLQGSGIGVTMLRNAMAEYRRMGVRRVTTQANIDAGSYTWAKFGFAPERAEWLALRQRLRFKVQNLAGLDVISADDLKTALDVLESDDPKAIWRVSDLRGATKVRLGKGRMATVGQALLQNENWRGILDLRDEETMTRFRAYANR